MDANHFDLLAKQSQGHEKRSARRSNRRSTTTPMNPNFQIQKLQFELTIRKLFLQNAPDGITFMVLWLRGGKHIDTRSKPSQDGTVKIGDKFQMKTSLEFDTSINQFVPKPSQLQVVMIDENRGKVIIAEADFDLARFSKTQQVNE